METATVTVNLNKPCQECGKPGATHNGLCLGCITKAITGKRMKSAVGRAVAARSKAARMARAFSAYLDGEISIDDVVDRAFRRPHWLYVLFLSFVLPEDLALRMLEQARR